MAGAEGVWVGRSGRARAVTVGATFGVLVGDRGVPFRPTTLPAHVQSSLAVDRSGGFLYSCVNDDNDVAAAEEAVGGGKLSVNWVYGGGGVVVRGGGGFLRKLGRRSGPPRTIGISAVVSIVVAFASTASDAEVEPLLVGSESLLVRWYGREPDGREGTGGMGVVGGFL